MQLTGKPGGKLKTIGFATKATVWFVGALGYGLGNSVVSAWALPDGLSLIIRLLWFALVLSAVQLTLAWIRRGRASEQG